jgi:hypothetical protein
MFMMIDTSTTGSIAGLARATATASAMSMAIRPSLKDAGGGDR